MKQWSFYSCRDWTAAQRSNIISGYIENNDWDRLLIYYTTPVQTSYFIIILIVFDLLFADKIQICVPRFVLPHNLVASTTLWT